VQNQSWASDTIELVTGGGKLYLAAVLDLYSRFVVGWAVSVVNDRHLVTKALDMAPRRRCLGAGLLHHSDQAARTRAKTSSASWRDAALPAA
jgi:putative transposase